MGDNLIEELQRYLDPQYDDLGAFIDDIAEQAIIADMEHRGYERNDDGDWEYNEYIDPMDPDERGPASMPRNQGEALDNEVFNYWPQAIADVFLGWDSLPDSSGLTTQASTVNGSLEPIAVAGKGKFTGDIQTDLTRLEGRIGEQRGRYAQAFFDNYVAGLGTTIGNLYALGATLEMAATSQAQIIGRARGAVLDIARHATSAMRSSRPDSDIDGLAALKIGLIVVGATAAGVATFGTGTVAVVGAVVGASAGTANGLIGVLGAPQGEKETPELGADHPNDVLTNLKRAMSDLEEAFLAEEQAVRRLLTKAENKIDNRDDTVTFDLGRPALTSATDVTDIYNEREPEMTKSEIEDITDTWLPNIGGYVGSTLSGLGSTSAAWTHADNIGLGGTGPYPEYAALEGRLTDLVKLMVDDLDKGAQALDIASRHINNSDDAADERLSRKLREVLA